MVFPEISLAFRAILVNHEAIKLARVQNQMRYLAHIHFHDLSRGNLTSVTGFLEQSFACTH